MRRRSARISKVASGCFAVALLIVSPALAQTSAPTTEEAQESGPPAAEPSSTEPDFKFPLLSWYGSLEWDAGRATYDAEDRGVIDDSLQINQGRFVLGPLLHTDLTNRLAFEATGQLVAQIRERTNVYQINSDDVYGKFGELGVWDIQVGRFEAWKVYNKFPERDRDPRPYVSSNESTGAFDLFTLEDLGALCDPPISRNNYCVDIYEVNNILLRETVNSVAFHVFPLKGLGVELHAKYGEVSSINTLGARLAVIYRPVSFLQVSGAYEQRAERNASAPVSLDGVTGARIECTDCSRRDAQGFGGGVKLLLPPVEVAVNAAQTQIDFFRAQDGLPIPDNSPTVTSVGGYAQVDIGPITLGGALNNTISQAPEPAPNRQEHLQAAGYVYWPFFDNLSLKFVGTFAQGSNDLAVQRQDANGDGVRDVPVFTNKAIAGRLRLKYFFNSL